MGQAKRRGTFAERYEQAIELKKQSNLKREKIRAKVTVVGPSRRLASNLIVATLVLNKFLKNP